MMSLFVDTSYKSLFIGIVNNDFLIDSVQIMAEANFSEILIPELDKLIKKNNIKLKDLDKLFVTIGPGSFTGIRIGLAVCKTLALTLNKQIIPISSLEFMASTKVETKYKIPLIDARHGKVFAGVYDNDNNCIISDSYCSLNELTDKIDDSFTYIGYDDINNLNIIRPNYDVFSIVKRHFNDKEFNCHEIVPNYLKRTEAEEKLDG